MRFRTGTLTRVAVAAAAVLALGATFAAPLPQEAQAAPAAQGPTDYCDGQCSDILPPGATGNATLADILANRVFGTRPAHSADQLGPYNDLAQGYPQRRVDSASGGFVKWTEMGRSSLLEPCQPRSLFGEELRGCSVCHLS